MELFAVIYIWPFLLLAFALVFVAMADLGLGGGVSLTFLSLLAVLLILVRARNSAATAHPTTQEQLISMRAGVVVLSIAGLLPIFSRYFLEAMKHTLPAMILVLILGFGIALWGMFMKEHKVLRLANLFGGVLVLLYAYSQLWALGELPRIIAAAFGLIVAVTISVIKLREDKQ